MIKYTFKAEIKAFGNYYLSVMSSIAYCEKHNHTYVHIPLKRMSHKENKSKLMKFIGIPIDENKEYDKCINSKILKKTRYSKHPNNYFTENVLKKLRNYYYSTSKHEIEDVDIVIHIRRGDVDGIRKGAFMSRYTPNDKYIKIIDFLIKKYPNFKIKIVSEGKEEDFKELKRDNISFYLNKSLTQAFHYMVKSKIFVMSKSNLSYCAGILNENKVYYLPQWQSKLNQWIDISKNI